MWNASAATGVGHGGGASRGSSGTSLPVTRGRPKREPATNARRAWQAHRRCSTDEGTMRRRAAAWCAVLLAVAGCGMVSGGTKTAAPHVEGPRRVAVLPFRVRGFIDSTGRFASDPQAGPMSADLGVDGAERLTAD